MAKKRNLSVVENSVDQGEPCECGLATDLQCPRRDSAYCWHTFIDPSYDVAGEVIGGAQFALLMESVEELLIARYGEKRSEATRDKAQHVTAHVLEHFVVTREPRYPKLGRRPL